MRKQFTYVDYININKPVEIFAKNREVAPVKHIDPSAVPAPKFNSSSVATIRLRKWVKSFDKNDSRHRQLYKYYCISKRKKLSFKQADYILRLLDEDKACKQNN
jgi:hypothetical protein